MQWFITALAAIISTSSCLAADRPKPVSTAHLQVKYLFESGKPDLQPIPRYEVRSGKEFSILLPSKARPEDRLRVHSIRASPDGRIILIREEAAAGLHPFQWILIYRSPNPEDVPKFKELFIVAKEQGSGTESLVANHFPIHRNTGQTDPRFIGSLKNLKLKNDHLTFEEGPFDYKIRFEDCFENFPKPQA